MGFRDHFVMFGRYNAWANDRLYDAVAALPEAEYRRDRRAYFGSICGTLNHILVGDRIWLKRITGEDDEVPDRLDAILHEDFSALRDARRQQDERIAALTESYSEADLAGNLVYRNTRGDRFEQPLAQILAHFFNHQTHHRGQVHDMLSQAGVEPPELDLIYYLRRA